MADHPSLLTLRPLGRARAVVVVAHGGRSEGSSPTGPLQGTALRMYPFLADLHRAGWRRGLLSCQLRYRVVGWNHGDPVADLQWALGDIRSRHPTLPIALVGHSMGARACLRVAGTEGVTTVCALAPWMPPGEPVDQLHGRTVVLAHGVADRVTSPAASRRFAERAAAVATRLCRFEVKASGHAMLQRPLVWQQIARDTVMGGLGLEPLAPLVTRALALPVPDSCEVPV